MFILSSVGESRKRCQGGCVSDFHIQPSLFPSLKFSTPLRTAVLYSLFGSCFDTARQK